MKLGSVKYRHFGAATPIQTSRAIARAAVRARLASIALGQFTHRGFDSVTITEVAQAAGVSRSTFLRYFETKEEAVLCAVDPAGEGVAARLMDRPASEDDWTALRRCFDDLIENYLRDPEQTTAALRLVKSVPSISGRRLERQCSWATNLARALDRRAGANRTEPAEPTIRAIARANAALSCMTVAVDRWTASGGQLELGTLIDDAFAALAGLRPNP